jgi:serine/threonine protein kinase/Flp pilus assembly protein TadD
MDVSKTPLPDALQSGSDVPTTLTAANSDSVVTSPHLPLTEPLPLGPADTLPGYEILEELGRGGMGVVYKARHLGLKRLVALKMILSAEHAGADELARFRAEAEAIARLQHPNIVQVYDIGEHNGKPYFALEFVSCGSLAACLHGEPQPPREAAHLLETLARAIDVAHQQGIVHRDLKPANVLLQRKSETRNPKSDTKRDGTDSDFEFRISDFEPKVSDFGLAKQLDDDTGRTRTGAIMGTPSYMAPEQAAGEVHAIGPATDTYALGAILYELLTGRPPFRGACVLDTLEQVRTQDAVPPSRLIARLPRDLETIGLKCLDKDPARRYSSAAALADDLRRYLDDRPILARPAGRWEQLRKFTRRKKLLVASVTAVILALVLGIIGTSLGMARAWVAEKEALENLDRAVEAEKIMRRDLARSHWDNARLAAGHGRWREALALFDRALEAGYEDEVAVEMQKLTALLALHETQLAQDQIALLARRSDLGDRESSLLLARGSLALGEWSGQQAALADVRLALQKGLPADEAAYAQALLADWPQDAARHLRQALALNPSHPEARQHLLPVLFSLGHFEECRQEANTLLAFFPEDPSPKVFLAVVALLEGDLEAARAHIQHTEAQFGKKRVALLQDAVGILHEALQAAAVSDQPKVSPFLLPRLFVLFTRFQQVDPQSPLLQHFHTVNLPALAHVWKPIYTAVMQLSTGPGRDTLATQLEDIVAHHPEGVAYFLHGTALMWLINPKKKADLLPQLRRVELSFRRGMDAPCVVPAIRRLNRYWGAYAEALLAKPDPALSPADAEMRQRARSNVQRLLLDGVLSPDQLKTLTDLALHRLEDHDLARLLVTTGERQAPRDLEFVRWRAQIELAAGAYHPALEAAGKVLAKWPKDADALRVREKATEKLREK